MNVKNTDYKEIFFKVLDDLGSEVSIDSFSSAFNSLVCIILDNKTYTDSEKIKYIEDVRSAYNEARSNFLNEV